ncbi:unnamed protein product [Strongylus vulgaris]|uniref:Peptidase C1A papain C-terminal domain-containing protein n=1 Tax=Strongylus vulgaris TaxID=40348 RepID=A0A3P7J0E4_STRVU|nr:unnamed protein product [Strongylus vulgaris]
MDWKYIETSDPMIRGKAPEIEAEIPERCDGGFPMRAWYHVIIGGACSGGPYRQRVMGLNVCKPYPFRPCGHYTKHPIYEQCPKERQITPKCRLRCSLGYNKTYKEDVIYAKSAHYLKTNETEIQKEIMMNGPVQASFKVYGDFLTYEKGIYRHTAGEDEGGHAVKIIGWGVENDVKYWLVANSWNTGWGEDGYVRFLRGENECEIETRIIAGFFEA